ncbi:MAG: gliding motility-associated C-terminal domain-containing protein [Bacteroidales bacterium]
MKHLYLYIILLLFPVFTYAQVYISEGASLNTSKKSELFFDDSFEIQGALNNQGDIYVTGDLINDGEYYSIGTLYLVGYNQTISMNGDTVNELIVQGSGNKYLLSDMYISGELMLDNGIIIPTNQSNLIIMDTAYISEGSDYSYVLGRLYSEGDGDKYFPVGTATTFLPVELHNIKGDSLTIGMKAHYFDSLPVPGKGTRKLSHTNYWSQDVLSGNVTYAQISLPMYLVGNTGFYSEDSVVVAMSDNVLGPYRSNGKDESISSIIPYEYVSSEDIDTANRDYYTLGIFYDLNWNLFYIPNALSHNASDEDDRCVKVYGDVFQEKGFSFIVKNQWGNIVFESTSLEQMESEGWDGYNQKTGNRGMIGQYQYVLKAFTKHNEIFTKAGSIWIIN